MFNKKESSSLEHNKCGIDGWKLVSKACGKEQDKCIISKYLLTKYLLENTHTHTHTHTHSDFTMVKTAGYLDHLNYLS